MVNHATTPLGIPCVSQAQSELVLCDSNFPVSTCREIGPQVSDGLEEFAGDQGEFWAGFTQFPC